MTDPETPSPSPLTPEERFAIRECGTDIERHLVDQIEATESLVRSVAKCADKMQAERDSLAARVSDLEAAARLVVSTREAGCVFHEEHSGGKPCGSCLFSDAVAALAEVFRDGFEKAGARLTPERDEAREQVRSLTVERDAAREEAAWMRSERDKWRDFKPVTADLVDRLSRAREALAAIDAAAKEGERAQARLPWYGPASSEDYEASVEAGEKALAALRAALAEPLGGP